MRWPTVALLGPERCVGCRRPRGVLCPHCAGDLAPAPAPTLPPGVACVAAAWSYEGPARALVLDLKLRARRPIAEVLAAGLHHHAPPTALSVDVLTWVPAARGDVRRRGFDHAEEIALRLSERTGIPLRGLLRRRPGRRDQSGLGAGDRRRNMAGAFVAHSCTGTVAVVDDVITTGATASACAAALACAGAERVHVVCACATPR